MARDPRGTILYEPPSTKDVRFPGRKLAFSANYQEDYIGILPVGRSRFKVVARDQFAACQETSTHMPNFTGVPMRSLWRVPKLTKEDKATLTGVAGPTYSEEVAALFPNGEPLFWLDLKDVLFYVALFKHLCASHIFDLTPGHGSAAIAAVILGLKYDGVAMSDQHMNCLDNWLDQAIFPIIADSEDTAFAEEVTRYFAPLVDQGRRLVENDVTGAGEPEAEEEDEEEVEGR